MKSSGGQFPDSSDLFCSVPPICFYFSNHHLFCPSFPPPFFYYQPCLFFKGALRFSSLITKKMKNAKGEEELEDCLTHEMAREGALHTLMVSTETRHH